LEGKVIVQIRFIGQVHVLKTHHDLLMNAFLTRYIQWDITKYNISLKISQNYANIKYSMIIFNKPFTHF